MNSNRDLLDFASLLECDDFPENHATMSYMNATLDVTENCTNSSIVTVFDDPDDDDDLSSYLLSRLSHMAGSEVNIAAENISKQEHPSKFINPFLSDGLST